VGEEVGDTVGEEVKVAAGAADVGVSVTRLTVATAGAVGVPPDSAPPDNAPLGMLVTVGVGVSGGITMMPARVALAVGVDTACGFAAAMRAPEILAEETCTVGTCSRETCPVDESLATYKLTWS
jgi:hypothetical protein